MSADLQVDVDKHGETFVIAISGEIDLSNADKLLAATELALSNKTCATIALDLRFVSFIDCAGLSALTRIAAECEQHSTVFSIADASAAVRHLVRIAGAAGALSLT